MAERKNFICMLRKFDKYPNGTIQRFIDDTIGIKYNTGLNDKPQVIICDQKDARLFAKRITQFLNNGG